MIEVAGKSVCGPRRQNNEDSFGFRSVGKYVIFAVADGLGGCPYGEVASQIAVNKSLDYVSKCLEQDEKDLEFMLEKAFNTANIGILRDCAANPDHDGMASTLTFAVMSDDSLTIAHYGDCRCYLVRGDELIQITEDHNLAAYLVRKGRITKEEAVYHVSNSQIINCLGENKFIKPDIHKYNIIEHDCVILASDGMYSLFDEETCRDILQRRDDPEALCDLLMERGASEDSTDNSTVVIARSLSGQKTED